jgi:hypothetical protein
VTAVVTPTTAEFSFTGFKHAASGGADLADSVVLHLPTGPIPLAARGLTALLARVGPVAGSLACQGEVGAG